MVFGPGPELAAQCPRVSAPDGWRLWTDEDGPVPDALTKRALAISNDQTIPLGTSEGYPLPGVVALIRTEPRVWTRDAQGNFVEGCFRSAGVYLPAGAVPGAGVTPPEESSGLAKLIGVLTVVSLAVGTVATVATWKRK